MAKLSIQKEGSAILRKKSEDVKIIDNNILKLSANMLETMEKENGLGLAAPQVGKSLRLICVKSKEGNLVFVNPVILKKSFRKNTAEEGCLSVPGIYGYVKRHNSITLVAESLERKKLKLKAKGLMARVIQHELDHLLGILFTDKVEKNHKGTKDERKI